MSTDAFTKFIESVESSTLTNSNAIIKLFDIVERQERKVAELEVKLERLQAMTVVDKRGGI